jgi:hypothetical protein
MSDCIHPLLFTETDECAPSVIYWDADDQCLRLVHLLSGGARQGAISPMITEKTARTLMDRRDTTRLDPYDIMLAADALANLET